MSMRQYDAAGFWPSIVRGHDGDGRLAHGREMIYLLTALQGGKSPLHEVRKDKRM